MVGKRKALPRLGDLEMAVLQHLWKVDEADVLQTHSAVAKRRGITANTVGSSLERLHRKALVVRHKVSHAYRYRAALTEDDFTVLRMMDALDHSRTLTDAGILAAFVDLVADEDEALLDRLEALIAQRRAERGHR